MKRIFITIIMAVVLYGGIAVECAVAADRNYKIENCNRKKVWTEVFDYINWNNQNLKVFIEKNIKPTKEDPKLTEDDYKQIEQLDKNIQWFASECVLLMKEINVLIKAVHEVDPEQTFYIANIIEKNLNKEQIPSLWNSKGVNDLAVFSFNFAPFSPEKNF